MTYPHNRDQADIRRRTAANVQRLRREPRLPNDPRNMGENADVLPGVFQRGRMGGWRLMHVRQQGWRKALNGAAAGVLQMHPSQQGKGWPDVSLWPEPQTCRQYHEVRGLVLELKDETNKVTPEQADWLLFFGSLPTHEAAVIRPRHLADRDRGLADTLYRRLVLHECCRLEWSYTQNRLLCAGDCTGWCRLLWPGALESGLESL